MKRLAMIDDTFLRLESRRQPLHIGVLLLLEPPEGAGKDFAKNIAERLRSYTSMAPPFNLRLVNRRGVHYWREDSELDLDHHFVHLSLPAPGRIRELLAMVSPAAVDTAFIGSVMPQLLYLVKAVHHTFLNHKRAEMRLP